MISKINAEKAENAFNSLFVSYENALEHYPDENQLKEIGGLIQQVRGFEDNIKTGKLPLDKNEADVLKGLEETAYEITDKYRISTKDPLSEFHFNTYSLLKSATNYESISKRKLLQALRKYPVIIQ